MTSQILAIVFLNDLDHFIKENLGIKYYVRYQDDGCLYHHSKEYLRYCLEQIRVYLENEKLVLNKKTRIYKSNNNFIFLGRDVNGKYGKYSKYRNANRRLKKKYKIYRDGVIKMNSLIASKKSYNYLFKRNKLL